MGRSSIDTMGEEMADLSLEVHRLKKTAIPMPRDGVGTSG